MTSTGLGGLALVSAARAALIGIAVMVVLLQIEEKNRNLKPKAKEDFFGRMRG